MTNKPTDKQDQWKVFRLNDCDWWLARSLDEAINSSVNDYYGGDPDMIQDEVRELTPQEMVDATYTDEDGDESTFEAELQRRIAEGITKPELFATTEY